MKPLNARWGWGVLAAILVAAAPSLARPNPGSDAEPWRPIAATHRVNRYRSAPSLSATQRGHTLARSGAHHTRTVLDQLRSLVSDPGGNELTKRSKVVKDRNDPLQLGEDNDSSALGPLQEPRARQSGAAPKNEQRGRLDPKQERSERPEQNEVKWLPVSLAPAKHQDEGLVDDFLSNSLPDLNIPEENTGTLVKIVSPASSWGSDSLDELILSHKPEPVHHHKPTTWHKRPTVILVQDTPQELLPKPPHHHQEDHSTPAPEPFPRPTYHFPRPSPEPPPSYHYPSAEPSLKPVHHYKPSTHKPIHHYPTPIPEPHFPYTSVIIHTSTFFHPDADPEPEPSPEPPWSSHFPYPEPEPEDPDPEPVIIVGDDDEPIPEPEPPADHPYYDEPVRPSPPPIYTVATPISAGRPPVSPLNPVTVSSGQRPPSIVILSSPEDDPVSPPQDDPLDDPAPPAAGGGGGGGLIPIIPPIVPGLAGPLGSLAGAVSDCPSVQLYNVQNINNVENKDCVINLNALVHNVNGGGQIEGPIVQGDVPLDDIPDSSTVATTTKRPSTGSVGVLEYIISFFSSITIFNPISLSFWSFLFAPVSILLASGLGVAALVLPWFFPSYWFARRVANRRADYYRGPPYYRFGHSALRFERSLQSGMDLNSFLDSIGLL